MKTRAIWIGIVDALASTATALLGYYLLDPQLTALWLSLIGVYQGLAYLLIDKLILQETEIKRMQHLETIEQLRNEGLHRLSELTRK